jgi:hypothetical protein
MSISYTNAPVQVRDDIIAAHDHAWKRLARGAWFDGKTRLAIAAETRHASKCALCSRRKEAVSPHGISGRHDGFGTWLCINPLERGLIRRDFSDVAAIGHFADFGAFSFRKGF